MAGVYSIQKCHELLHVPTQITFYGMCGVGHLEIATFNMLFTVHREYP
jgi:hypothetical protein